MKKADRLLNPFSTTKISAQSFRIDRISYKDGIKVLKQEYKPIPMLTKRFYIGLRELDAGTYDTAIAVETAGHMEDNSAILYTGARYCLCISKSKPKTQWG